MSLNNLPTTNANLFGGIIDGQATINGLYGRPQVKLFNNGTQICSGAGAATRATTGGTWAALELAGGLLINDTETLGANITNATPTAANYKVALQADGYTVQTNDAYPFLFYNNSTAAHGYTAAFTAGAGMTLPANIAAIGPGQGKLYFAVCTNAATPTFSIY